MSDILSKIYSTFKKFLLAAIILFIISSPILALFVTNYTNLSLFESFQTVGVVGSMILTLLLALLYRGLVNVQKDQTELLEKQQKTAEVNTTPIIEILDIYAKENVFYLEIQNVGEGFTKNISANIRYALVEEQEPNFDDPNEVTYEDVYSFKSQQEGNMMAVIEPAEFSTTETSSVRPSDGPQYYKFQTFFADPKGGINHYDFDQWKDMIKSDFDFDYLMFQIDLRYNSTPPMNKSYESYSRIYFGELEKNQSLDEFINNSEVLSSLRAGWSEYGFKHGGTQEEITLPINREEDGLFERLF